MNNVGKQISKDILDTQWVLRIKKVELRIRFEFYDTTLENVITEKYLFSF